VKADHNLNTVKELQKLVTPQTKTGLNFDTIVRNGDNYMRHSAD